MFDILYENVGGKIKRWAIWIFIVEAISAIVTGLSLIMNDDSAIGFLLLICGPIAAWVGSWLLYAFGQLVEDVHAMREKEGTTTEIKAKREAKETVENNAEISALAKEDYKNGEEPADFEPNEYWEKEIKNLPSKKLRARYLDKGNYADTYRHMCYLELKNRNEL